MEVLPGTNPLFGIGRSASNEAVSLVTVRSDVQLHLLFAERTLQLLTQPVINTLFVELVRALHGLHHLSRLEIIETDGARLFVLVAACGFTI